MELAFSLKFIGITRLTIDQWLIFCFLPITHKPIFWRDGDLSGQDDICLGP